MVQSKDDMSTLTPGGSQAKEVREEDSSEDEDEIRIHLNTMLKAMQKIDKVNEERNTKFDSLYELSLTQQETNIKQL